MTTPNPTTTRPPETTSNVVTSWIPIPSHPLQSGCSSHIWALQGMTTNSQGWVFDVPYGQIVNTDVKCQPDGITTSWLSRMFQAGGASTVWSAGPLVCPDASYTLLPSNVCTSPISLSQILTFAMRNPSMAPDKLTYVPAHPKITTQAVFSTTTMASASHLRGLGVAGFVFDEKVVAMPTPTSMTSTGTRLVPTVSGPSPIGDSQTTSSFIGDETKKKGLGNGAKVGVGVGVGVGVVVLVAVAFLLLFLMKRRKRQRGAKMNEMAAVEKSPSEVKEIVSSDGGGGGSTVVSSQGGISHPSGMPSELYGGAQEPSKPVKYRW
ncbi:hypothetical protein B0J14DRAFT_659062 [Halenospora varia]|nr:hypothetical protein B0J14DRAFT_659062 [Halenospora varia]